MNKQFRDIYNSLPLFAGLSVLAGCLFLTTATVFAQESNQTKPSQEQLPIAQKSGTQVQSSRNWGSLQFLGPDTVADVATQIAPFVVHIDVKLPGDYGTIVRSKKKGLRPLPQRGGEW